MSASGHDLAIASLGERFVAASIDGGLIVGAVGAVIGGAIGASALIAKEPATASERFEQLAERMPALDERPWPQLVKTTSGLADVALRNTRSPGMRVMRIRRADARTGGPVTLRSAIIRQLVGLALGRLGVRVWRPAFERYQERSKALAAEFQEVRRQHPDDPEAESAFFSSHANTGMASCCGAMVVSIAVQYVTTMLSPHRQNVSDWVAGIVVIRD
jgi:hypothetical protein